VAGEDYPATYRGFVAMFPDDEACLRYVEELRSGLTGSHVRPAAPRASHGERHGAASCVGSAVARPA